MKPEKQGVVIYDCSFGFGPSFRISNATWNDKTVTYYKTTATIGKGDRHLCRTQRFAVVTKELSAEAQAITKASDELQERARAFKKKLEAAEPK